MHVLSGRGQGEYTEDATVGKAGTGLPGLGPWHPSSIPVGLREQALMEVPTITIDDQIPIPLDLQRAAHFHPCLCSGESRNTSEPTSKKQFKMDSGSR